MFSAAIIAVLVAMALAVARAVIGPTAFAVFTLSKCGYGKSDNHVHRALRWLDKNAPQRPVDGEFDRCSSYESAAVILMIASLNERKGKPAKRASKRKRSDQRVNPRLPPEGSAFPKADWTWMHWHILNLLDCQDTTGYFGYYSRLRGYSDVSATQFALLALRDASRAGYPVEEVAPDVWERAARVNCGRGSRLRGNRQLHPITPHRLYDNRHHQFSAK